MHMNPREVLERGIISCDDGINKNQIQSDGVDLRIAEDVIIEKGNFVNVSFMEKFDMKGVHGKIITRSSLSRKGAFCTAGLYDNGFKNGGGCSIYNFNDQVLKIEKGTRICQMVCYISKAVESYDGYYNHNNGEIISKFDANNNLKMDYIPLGEAK